MDCLENPFGRGGGWLAAGISAGNSDEWDLLPMALHLFHLLVEGDGAERLAGRDRFLAIASHELKTPLTALYGLMQLQERMLRGSRLPVDPDALAREQERHLSFARTMLRQIEKLVELTDGLIDLSKIRAGRFGVEPIPHDAARAVRELHEGRLKVLADEAGVELSVRIPERLATRLDPLSFDELVTNLSLQAIRRSPEGGQVLLSLEGTGEGTGPAVRLSVRLSVRLQGRDFRFIENESGSGYGNQVEATFWKAG